MARSISDANVSAKETVAKEEVYRILLIKLFRIFRIS